MPIDAPPDTCPSCKVGTLVTIEQTTDGCVEFFSCGHKQHRVLLKDMLEFHASLGFKAKKMGIGRPYIEGRTGDSFLFKTGKWMFLERIIDRARNWYKELIIDPETGTVIRSCGEPLTDHRDHGSARKKPGP